MRRHKFKVGQTVEYTPGFNESGGRGQYTVVRLLPDAGDTPQYRIKSTADGRERMALEYQLSRSTASAAARRLFAPRDNASR